MSLHYTVGLLYLQSNEYAWKVSIEEIRERGFNLDIKNPNDTIDDKLPASTEVLIQLKESISKINNLLTEIEK